MVGVTGSIPVAPTTASGATGSYGRSTNACEDRPITTDFDDVIILKAPGGPIVPLLLSSPHSGRNYLPEFLAMSRLDGVTLRRSEDCYVDELFAAGPEQGATLIAAQFPRAWCDVNREAWELDQAMFADPLPGWVNTHSPRVAAGFGTVARIVSTGDAIYKAPLRFAEVQARVASCWQPYHAALARLTAQMTSDFGACLLVDCHSMPAHACAGKRPMPDIVLGDAFGAACPPDITREVESFLMRRGYVVHRNDPYAGGYVTRHYGRPARGVHALQIEIARALYMDERSLARTGGFERVRADMQALIGLMAELASRFSLR